MSIPALMPVYPRCDVRPVKGDHCHLIDEDGTRYLDFASGIAVNLLGHSHEGLIGAIQKQAETLMHVSNLYGSPHQEKLAQMLVDATFADTVFFTNSGAEAVECAIKTARAFHQHEGGDPARTELITFTSAFHGRTMATISASNQAKMHHGFLPLLEGFQYCEFDDLEAARAMIGPKTAGFLVERGDVEVFRVTGRDRKVFPGAAIHHGAVVGKRQLPLRPHGVDGSAEVVYRALHPVLSLSRGNVRAADRRHDRQGLGQCASPYDPGGFSQELPQWQQKQAVMFVGVG